MVQLLRRATSHRHDNLAKQTTAERRKKLPAVAEQPSLKLVRLQLPAEVHRQFRIEAAKNGMSMATLARRLVEEWTPKRKNCGK